MEEQKHQTSPVDYAGAALMTVGLVALLTGIEFIGTVNWLIVAGLIGFAVIVLIIMFRNEDRVTDPIIPSRLFRNRPLMIDFALFTLIWGAFIGFLIYSPMWAQGLLGTSALIGGATQIPGSVTDFLGSGTVAPMRRFLTPQRVVAVGILTLIISFALLVFAGVKTPYWILLIAGAFEGFGNGACFNELQIKVQQDADMQDVPIATSFSFLIRMLSQTFTASIFGIILNHALKNGVIQSGGRITMQMMNKLSDATNIGGLPQNLIPQMRAILFNGLHNIMVLSLGLMLISLAINVWAQKLEHEKYQLKNSEAAQTTEN
jgi:hypothetical protein